MNTLTLNLAASVFMHARTDPGRTALVVGDGAYSYAALAETAGRIAGWLRTCVSPDGGPLRVGVLAARSLETYAGIVGAAWAGATYIPLDPKQPTSRLASVIERSRIDALIVDARGVKPLGEFSSHPPHILIADDADAVWRDSGRCFTTSISDHAATEVADSAFASAICVADANAESATSVTALRTHGNDETVSTVTRWASLANYTPLPAPVAVAPDHPAYIIYTSGTTGQPKGVVVTAANVAHFLASVRALFHIGPTDRVGQFFETTFDVSVSEMFACWQGGAALHVVPEMKVMAPGGFIRQHGITVWHAVPSLIAIMKKVKQLEAGSMPSLRVSIFGGEGVPVSAVHAWQKAAPNSSIDNQYGPTESTVGCIWQRYGEQAVETPGRGTLAIGKPFPGTHAAVVGPNLDFLRDGATGELALSGPQVAFGYADDDELTARRFRTLDHPTLGRDRWYLTGDSAYIDPRGDIHCLGRIDNQVKVLGHRIELEEIDAHLRAVCGIESVATIAWPIVNGNAIGMVAFVSGTPLDANDIREQLRRRVPVYMIPTRVVSLDTLPLSPSGKVDRRGLCTLLEGKVPA